ncbi:MAG: hypothetical protein H8E60_01460 [Candidatus Marinimicrobia bacterium]|nr:hypothetical protein [Candidatus Neomarinimicrobiota bacterium]
MKNIKWMGGVVLLSLLMTGFSFGGRGYDLDDFDDFELESLNKQKKKSAKEENKSQRLILFDDNLYLLDDDFDFGADELELQKLELNPNDMETAKEYEEFLNAFFENSSPVGTSSYSNSKKSFQEQSKKSNKITKRTSPPSRKVPDGSNRSVPPSQSFRPSRGALGFGVSTIIGATIPVTMNGFSTGSNFGIRIDTPISFNLAGMEANVGTDIYFSSMNASEGSNNLKLTNIIGNISLFPLQSIEIRTGLGFTPTSIGDYSVSALSIPVDVNYYLPMNFSGFKFALNLHAQRTLGYPSKEGVSSGDSTDFLYVGLLINTPLKF